MAQQSMSAPGVDTTAKLNELVRLTKQLKVAMTTIGNIDERLSAMESMINSALFKQQEDIRQAYIEINALKSANQMAEKFDLDATVAQTPGVPPTA